MNEDQMKAELARLKAENEALKEKKQTKISFKVGEKGALSLYGLGRFPVTLYKTQWERLLGASDDIRAALVANADKLKSKE